MFCSGFRISPNRNRVVIVAVIALPSYLVPSLAAKDLFDDVIRDLRTGTERIETNWKPIGERIMTGDGNIITDLLVLPYYSRSVKLGIKI